MLLTEAVLLLALCCGHGGIFAQTVYLAGQHGRNYGRVEVLNNYVRGTICDDSWDDDDAKVICRQLGLSMIYAHAVTNGKLGRGSGPIWMDNVECTGTESSIGSCTFPGYGKHDCSHSEDAGVLCQGTPVSLFLGGTHGTNYGRLQAMYTNNTVGTICDDSWDDDDAKVACSQLGHPTNHAKAVGDAYFGAGTGPIWLDEVSCSGTESNIYSCSHNNIGVNNCGHGEDAGVICGYDLDVRLVNTNNFEQLSDGVVQIKLETSWIYVDFSSSIGTNESVVICRQLGLPTRNTGTYRMFQSSFQATQVYPQIISHIECTGLEINVGHCKFTVKDMPLLDQPHGYRETPTTYLVCGETSNIIPTFVNISMDNETINVPVGEDVSLVCRTPMSRPLRILQWYTNGSLILHHTAITTSFEIVQNSYYVTTSILKFNSSFVENGTLIGCESKTYFSNIATKSKNGIFRTGVPVRTVTIQPATPISVLKNSHVLVSCLTSWSNPQATIQWFLNGEALFNISVTESTTRRDNLYRTTSTLNYKVPSQGCSILKFICKSMNDPASVAVWSAETQINVKDESQRVGVASSSFGSVSKQTFTVTTAVLGVSVSFLASIVTCLVVKLLRNRSKDKETMQQPVVRTISGPVSSNVNRAFVAASCPEQMQEGGYETLQFQTKNCPPALSSRRMSPEIYENTTLN